MQVQHGTSVIVTDGCKALLLRNEGDAEFPDLRLVRKWEQVVGPDRSLKSDAPGRTFSSSDGESRRSSYEQADYHQAAEAAFTLRLCGFLLGRITGKDIRELIVVAPARTLGQFRRHFRPEVVTAEIAKDLVKHPIAEIERLLASYPEPVG